jgi:hypothetical protein
MPGQYPCPHRGCNKVLKNKSGLTQHCHSKHGYPLPLRQQRVVSPTRSSSPQHTEADAAGGNSDFNGQCISFFHASHPSQLCLLSEGNASINKETAADEAGGDYIVDYHSCYVSYSLTVLTIRTIIGTVIFTSSSYPSCTDFTHYCLLTSTPVMTRSYY